VISYTDEEPVSLPVAEPVGEQTDQIKQAIQAYQSAGDSDQSGTLELTAEEINALIADIPELAGRAYVDIVDDQLMAQGSVSLDMVPGFSGRYLNGNFSLSLNVENSQVLGSITDLDLENQEIPEQFKQDFLSEFQNLDVLEQLGNPQGLEQLLQGVDRIEIEDGTLSLIRE